jgi:hypothetical protein
MIVATQTGTSIIERNATAPANDRTRPTHSLGIYGDFPESDPFEGVADRADTD